ncbi:MAG TPA: M28 family peptidase [Gemmatimonadales bacterium]|nr:M28 family peptidase [Gemmatimonadales bacterium]
MTRSIGFACLLATGVLQTAASQSPAVKQAAGTITEADVHRRIFLIADDSMGGRDTPSPGLSKTANYIASEFKRFGLRPGGDSGSYLLKYPIASKAILAGKSTVRFGNSAGDRAIETTLAAGAAWVNGATSATASASVVLVGGTVVPDSVRAEDVRDKIVVYVPAPSPQQGRGGFRAQQRLAQLGARAVVVVLESDSMLANYQQRQRRPQTTIGDPPRGAPVVAIQQSLIIAQVPEAADQFAELRSAATTVVQPMPDWSGEIALRDTTLSLGYAPDVVGILEGSDPVLKQEYVVFSAHMDHIGTAGRPGAQCAAMGADSICNGADDDGSGTVGVLELAEAFSQKGARPKRSMIFLTVSGEEHGLWGSAWFTNHPPAPLPQIVADLNADMIGRNWKDTIVAIGKEHSDLGSTLNRVNSAHPELHMVAIDDRWPEESFYTRSDHYNFARKGVPILFFFNGVHADYHRPSDSPDKIDAEKESRVVKLLFYLGQEVGNAANRPKWVAESYRQIVQL